MIIIRKAEKGDLPTILKIYNHIIINTTAVYQYQEHTLQMREQWFELKQQQGFPVFVALENNVVAGFSTIGPFRQWQAYKYTVENSVYVAEETRGKGIGKLLLQPLIDESVKMDMHTIIAGIDASNEASLQLHKSSGFTEAAHFKQVGYKFNRWLDVVFLQLILKIPLTPYGD